MWNLVLAQAETPATPGATGVASPFGGTGMILFFAVFIGIFYFLLIRPNQKRDKQRRDMLSRLSKGDRVVTNGGVVGTIVGLSEKTAVLRVSEEPLVKMEFLRGAINRVVTKEEEKA